MAGPTNACRWVSCSSPLSESSGSGINFSSIYIDPCFNCLFDRIVLVCIYKLTNYNPVLSNIISMSGWFQSKIYILEFTFMIYNMVTSWKQLETLMQHLFTLIFRNIVFSYFDSTLIKIWRQLLRRVSALRGIENRCYLYPLSESFSVIF